MTRPSRAALPILLLLLAQPALGQTSLGQPGSLPPPRPAAPVAAPQASPAQAPAQPPAASRPQAQSAPARPPGAPAAAAPPRPPAATATPRPPATPQAGAPPRPAPPTLQQRPGTSNSAQPARPAQGTQAGSNPNRRRAAGAAAGVAAGAVAGAAGAAALGAARPPEPAQPAAPPPPPKPAVGSATGLPLPRFAALGSNQVNLRIGPDLRYKIEWTYQRKDLPVQIVEEHQIWRRIRDPEGTEGWVQRPLLTSRRTFLVQGEERVLRRRPEEDADPVARLKPGVIGAIRKCEEKSPWCEARVGEYSGWIRRSEVWGVTPDEAVN